MPCGAELCDERIGHASCAESSLSLPVAFFSVSTAIVPNDGRTPPADLCSWAALAGPCRYGPVAAYCAGSTTWRTPIAL